MIKVRQYKDVIGQTLPKNILYNLHKVNKIPKIIWNYGDTGSGKSTIAELWAMTLTCERGGWEPCLECDTCRNNIAGLDSPATRSNLIKKINTADFVNKQDVKTAITEAFDLAPIPGKTTVYIFEEIHNLKQFEDMFFEKLNSLPEGVVVIGCTTKWWALSEPFKGRADLKLSFNKLTHTECLLLVNRLLTKYGKNLSESDKLLLVKKSKNNARVITKTLDTFTSSDNLLNYLREYLLTIDFKTYISIFESLFKDFPSFIEVLDILRTEYNLCDIWRGLNNFLLECSIYYYSHGVTLFTNHEKGQIGKIMKELSYDQVRRLNKLTRVSVQDDEDLVLSLFLDLNEVVTEHPVTIENAIADAKRESNIAQKNEAIKTQERKDKEVESHVKKLDMESLINMTNDTDIYEKKSNNSDGASNGYHAPSSWE